MDSKYEEVMGSFYEVKRGIEYREQRRKDLENSIQELELELAEDEEYIENYKKARKVIQSITDERNKSAKEGISNLVNQGLISILQEHKYRLNIEDGNRGDSQKITNVELISVETGKPRKVGTAVSQITSLIFIIALIELSNSSKFLVLDEYLSGSSGETASKLSDVLVSLAENNGFQFFLVNHVLNISDNPNVVRYYLENDGSGLELNVEKTKKDMVKRQELIESKDHVGY